MIHRTPSVPTHPTPPPQKKERKRDPSKQPHLPVSILTHCLKWCLLVQRCWKDQINRACSLSGYSNRNVHNTELIQSAVPPVWLDSSSVQYVKHNHHVWGCENVFNYSLLIPFGFWERALSCTLLLQCACLCTWNSETRVIPTQKSPKRANHSLSNPPGRRSVDQSRSTKGYHCNCPVPGKSTKVPRPDACKLGFSLLAAVENDDWSKSQAIQHKLLAPGHCGEWQLV